MQTNNDCLDVEPFTENLEGPGAERLDTLPNIRLLAFNLFQTNIWETISRATGDGDKDTFKMAQACDF